MLAYVLLPMIGIGLLASLASLADVGIDDDANIANPPTPDPDGVDGTAGNDALTMNCAGMAVMTR